LPEAIEMRAAQPHPRRAPPFAFSPTLRFAAKMIISLFQCGKDQKLYLQLIY
jgi:hypothetical protein